MQGYLDRGQDASSILVREMGRELLSIAGALVALWVTGLPPSTTWMYNTYKFTHSCVVHAPGTWAAHSLAVLHVLDARALLLVRCTRSGSRAIPVILVHMSQSQGGKLASSSSRSGISVGTGLGVGDRDLGEGTESRVLVTSVSSGWDPLDRLKARGAETQWSSQQ